MTVPEGLLYNAGLPSSSVKDNPWRYAHLGTQLAAAVLLGLFVGYWADKRLGSGPWGLLAGGGIGVAVGLYLFMKEALGAGKDGPP